MQHDDDDEKREHKRCRSVRHHFLIPPYVEKGTRDNRSFPGPQIHKIFASSSHFLAPTT